MLYIYPKATKCVISLSQGNTHVILLSKGSINITPLLKGNTSFVSDPQGNRNIVIPVQRKRLYIFYPRAKITPYLIPRATQTFVSSSKGNTNFYINQYPAQGNTKCVSDPRATLPIPSCTTPRAQWMLNMAVPLSKPNHTTL